MAERLCAHEPCHCEPERGKEFCSPACTIAGRAAEGTFPRSQCPCGHPTCHPRHVPGDQPPPEAQP
jgi:hypothetical protein